MYLKKRSTPPRLPMSATLMLTLAAFVSFSAGAGAADIKVTLSGSQQSPPVKSVGTGTGTITVGDDKSVSGSVTAAGIVGTAAHIHLAPIGKDGPPIITLEQEGETYTVPMGAKLTEEQYAMFKAGSLYVNVHTKAYPGGEIRGQLKP